MNIEEADLILLFEEMKEHRELTEGSPIPHTLWMEWKMALREYAHLEALYLDAFARDYCNKETTKE